MIEAYIGPNGAGKTTFALQEARKIAKARDVEIYSNVEAEGVRAISDYEELASLRHCIVILDEILAIAGSREARSLPREIQLWLTTLRHSDVLLHWTSPSFERADVILREVTRRIHYVHPIKSVKSPERLWEDTTLSMILTRKSSDGEPDGGIPKIRLMNTKKHFGTFASHADIDVFAKK